MARSSHDPVATNNLPWHFKYLPTFPMDHKFNSMVFDRANMPVSSAAAASCTTMDSATNKVDFTYSAQHLAVEAIGGCSALECQRNSSTSERDFSLPLDYSNTIPDRIHCLTANYYMLLGLDLEVPDCPSLHRLLGPHSPTHQHFAYYLGTPLFAAFHF